MHAHVHIHHAYMHVYYVHCIGHRPPRLIFEAKAALPAAIIGGQQLSE